MAASKPPIRRLLSIEETSLNAYSTGLLQGKAYRSLSQYLTRALFPHQLSVLEWKLLGQLYEKGEMRLVELANLLDVRPPLVTNVVDALEKRAFLRRIRDPEDSRARLISATATGRAIIPRAEQDVKLAMHKLLDGVKREELLTYLQVLVKIVDNA